MFLGTVYSVEPIRLKKYPVFAAFCILAVRGVIVQVCHARSARRARRRVLTVAVRGRCLRQFGFYHHIRDVLHAHDLGTPSPEALASFMFGYPPRHVFAVVFVTVFSVVIALFKDLPDAEGDAKHGVKTCVWLRLPSRAVLPLSVAHPSSHPSAMVLTVSTGSPSAWE